MDLVPTISLRFAHAIETNARIRGPLKVMVVLVHRDIVGSVVKLKKLVSLLKTNHRNQVGLSALNKNCHMIRFCLKNANIFNDGV